MFNRSLEIKVRLYGADHPEIATLLNNLAAIYQDRGQLVKAERFYKRAIAVRKRPSTSLQSRSGSSGGQDTKTPVSFRR